MDLASAARVPREIRLEGGETVRVRKLDFGEWAEVTAYLLDRMPDPMTLALDQLRRARTRGVEPNSADADRLIRHASWEARFWPPRALTPTWFNLLQAVDGGMDHLLWVILKAADPTVTPERAAELNARLSDRDSLLIALASQGKDPTPPKSEAPTATGPNPTPTSN